MNTREKNLWSRTMMGLGTDLASYTCCSRNRGWRFSRGLRSHYIFDGGVCIVCVERTSHPEHLLLYRNVSSDISNNLLLLRRLSTVGILFLKCFPFPLGRCSKPIRKSNTLYLSVKGESISWHFRPSISALNVLRNLATPITDGTLAFFVYEVWISGRDEGTC